MIDKNNPSKRVMILWNGEPTQIKTSWGPHEFSSGEIEALARGETINFLTTQEGSGKPYRASGKLAWLEYNGHRYVGFDRDKNFSRVNVYGSTVRNRSFKFLQNTTYHVFTEAEVIALSHYYTLIYYEHRIDGSVYRVEAKLEDVTEDTAELVLNQVRES